MPLSENTIKEFQEIYKEKTGKELAFPEASDAAHNLVSFFKLLYDIDRRMRSWDERLKEYPNGFNLPESENYSCCICRHQVSGKSSWYDECGIKCLNCQGAVERGIVPKEVCSDRECWYDTYELQRWYGIKQQTARRLVREGKLIARIISDEDGTPYFYVFLIAENPGMLKPKPKGELIKTDDGRYTVSYQN